MPVSASPPTPPMHMDKSGSTTLPHGFIAPENAEAADLDSEEDEELMDESGETILPTSWSFPRFTSTHK